MCVYVHIYIYVLLKEKLPNSDLFGFLIDFANIINSTQFLSNISRYCKFKINFVLCEKSLFAR